MTAPEVTAFLDRMDIYWGSKFPMTEKRTRGWISTLEGFHRRDVNRALDIYIQARESSELDWPPSLPQLLAIVSPLHRRRVLAVEHQTARVEAAVLSGDEDAITAAREALESWA